MAEITKIAMNGILYDICDAKARKQKIVVDPYLSETSSNPVENRVVAKALAGAGGVTVDSELSETSENPVLNKVINEELKEVKKFCFIKDYRDKDSIPSDDTGTCSVFLNTFVVNYGNNTYLNRDIDDTHLSVLGAASQDIYKIKFINDVGNGSKFNGGTTIFTLGPATSPLSLDTVSDDTTNDDYDTYYFGSISFKDVDGNELTDGVYQMTPINFIVSTDRQYTVTRSTGMLYAYQTFIPIIKSGNIGICTYFLNAMKEISTITGRMRHGYELCNMYLTTYKHILRPCCLVEYFCAISDTKFTINDTTAEKAVVDGKEKYFTFIINESSNSNTTITFDEQSGGNTPTIFRSYGIDDYNQRLQMSLWIHKKYKTIFTDNEAYNSLPATNAEIKAIYDNTLSLNKY